MWPKSISPCRGPTTMSWNKRMQTEFPKAVASKRQRKDKDSDSDKVSDTDSQPATAEERPKVSDTDSRGEDSTSESSAASRGELMAEDEDSTSGRQERKSAKALKEEQTAEEILSTMAKLLLVVDRRALEEEARDAVHNFLVVKWGKDLESEEVVDWAPMPIIMAVGQVLQQAAAAEDGRAVEQSGTSALWKLVAIVQWIVDHPPGELVSEEVREYLKQVQQGVETVLKLQIKLRKEKSATRISGALCKQETTEKDRVARMSRLNNAIQEYLRGHC